MGSEPITFKAGCVHCGSQEFKYPDNPQPNDEVTCTGCGRTARFGDLQKSAVEQAFAQAAEVVRKTFGKSIK
jgi:predicted  nucleic acid-binding Zn-ribbon protein